LNNRKKAQLPLEVLKKFRIIFGSVRQHFREVERTCGVTGSQVWIMQEIAKNPGVGVSELAERLSIHQSTCSQLVEKLVVAKLVVKERNKEDMRCVGLQLTESATKLMKKAPGPAEGILPKALGALSEEAMRGLDSSLQKVIDQLQIKDEKLAQKPMSEL